MEPFKNWINIDVIQAVALNLSQHLLTFNDHGFIAKASCGLESRELKARTTQLAQALKMFLPSDFIKAAEVIQSSLGPLLGDSISGGQVDEQGISGWALMAFAEYVTLHEQVFDDDMMFNVGLDLLIEMTRRGSAEFAIRQFLLRQPDKTLVKLRQCAFHQDHHVRRLVSEGTRPRLPWGCHLPQFIQDPEPTLALLELLKHDDSEYVRRSVANHLNDIAKDHPDRVIQVANAWFDPSNATMCRLLRHACRTLLKSDNQSALALFGYKQPDIQHVMCKIMNTSITIGQSIAFEFGFTSNCDQKLMIDYIVYHQKSNGILAPKVFQWRRLQVDQGQKVHLKKTHSFKPITTRVYYAGLHRLAVKINGHIMCQKDFMLNAL